MKSIFLIIAILMILQLGFRVLVRREPVFKNKMHRNMFIVYFLLFFLLIVTRNI